MLNAIHQGFLKTSRPVLKYVDKLVLAALKKQLVRIGKQDGKRQLLAAFSDVQRVAYLDRDDGVHRLQNRLAKVQQSNPPRFRSFTIFLLNF